MNREETMNRVTSGRMSRRDLLKTSAAIGVAAGATSLFAPAARAGRHRLIVRGHATSP